MKTMHCFVDIFDWRYPILWTVLYVVVFRTAVALNIKSEYIFSSHIVSMINTLVFLWYHDLSILVGYYVYDTLLCITRKDLLFLTHHIGTLYAITLCTTDLNYDKIMKALTMLKTTDVFIHTFKIINATSLVKKYPEIMNKVLIVLSLMSNIVWLLFRVVLPCSLYPFYGVPVSIIAVLFHAANVYWMYKLNCVLYKLIEC